tara:strand:- start:17 stop:715 length:699 start_codon:yes stop_codon:yes gene_type:complete
MKLHQIKNQKVGLTLLEILAVIAIIAILASILIPAIVRGKIRAKVGMAKVDCQTIATSIKQYYDDYKRYPTRKGQKANTKGGDLTFDSVNLPNSDAIVILIDDTELSDVNKNHRANYKKTRYFEPKMTGNYDDQGIGPDGIFRDPFGNPYVISVDLNNDDKCSDLLYEMPGISGIASERIGHHGLMRETIGGEELFVLPGSVMVWSAGPDKETSWNVNAKEGVNYDNIIGWQ